MCIVLLSLLLFSSCETVQGIVDSIASALNISNNLSNNESIFEDNQYEQLVIRMERDGWPVEELNTAKDVDYLSNNEKGVILVTNAVRTNPSKFAEIYAKEELSYYNSQGIVRYPGKPTGYQTFEGRSAVEELISVLMRTPSMGVLQPSKGMSQGASDHSNDQARTGEWGHTGSGRLYRKIEQGRNSGIAKR